MTTFALSPRPSISSSVTCGVSVSPSASNWPTAPSLDAVKAAAACSGDDPRGDEERGARRCLDRCERRLLDVQIGGVLAADRFLDALQRGGLDLARRGGGGRGNG
jgi:hypothetical protein